MFAAHMQRSQTHPSWSTLKFTSKYTHMLPMHARTEKETDAPRPAQGLQTMVLLQLLAPTSAEPLTHPTRAGPPPVAGFRHTRLSHPMAGC